MCLFFQHVPPRMAVVLNVDLHVGIDSLWYGNPHFSHHVRHNSAHWLQVTSGWKIKGCSSMCELVSLVYFLVYCEWWRWYSAASFENEMCHLYHCPGTAETKKTTPAVLSWLLFDTRPCDLSVHTLNSSTQERELVEKDWVLAWRKKCAVGTLAPFSFCVACFLEYLLFEWLKDQLT